MGIEKPATDGVEALQLKKPLHQINLSFTICLTGTFINTDIQVYQVSMISLEEMPELPIERPSKLPQTRVH